MLTYSWRLPSEEGREARLHIHSSSSWFGIKEFYFRDQRVFRRGFFSGIDHRFSDPATGATVHLLMEQVGSSPTFRPALTVNGLELPESTGTLPPRVPVRPKSIAIATGVTYLMIFMSLVTLQSIANILDAVYLRTDTRKLVLNITEPEDSTPATQPAPLRVRSEQFPPVQVGQACEATVVAEGGEPPYVFERPRKGWPKALTLARDSGAIAGVPNRDVDLSGTVEVTDAAGAEAQGVFAIVVRELKVSNPEYPAILTESLPKATVGEEYRFQLEAVGGTPPLKWNTLSKDLPKGLSLNSDTGVITGQAESPKDCLVVIRVADSAYAASQDIKPWTLPVLTTAVCLLGFWSMRRWGVMLLAACIVAEIVLHRTGQASVSIVAVSLQGALLLLGLFHWRAMD